MKKILIAFMLFSLLFAFANAQLFKVVNIPTDDTLNMRSGAGVNYKKIAELPNDATNIKKLDTSANKKWYKISYENYGKSLVGWVFYKYIALQKNPKKREIPSYEIKKAYAKNLLNATFPNKLFKKDFLKHLKVIVNGYNRDSFYYIYNYKCNKNNTNVYNCRFNLGGVANEGGEKVYWAYEVIFEANNGNIKVKSLKLYD